MAEKIEFAPINDNESVFNFLRFFFLTLIMIGVFIAGYLLHRYDLLVDQNTLAKPDICTAIFRKGCDNALKSSFSSILGLPLSGWGIIYYLTLGVFLAVQAFTGSLLKKECMFSIFLLTLIASLVSITLLALMTIKPALFCPGCAAIHLINLVLFFISKKATGYSVSQFIKIRPTSFRPWISGYIKTLNRSKIVGFSIVLLTIGIFYVDLRQFVASPKKILIVPADPRVILSGYNSESIKNIPIDKDDPVLGPANTKVELVVFSDLTCPACRNFSRTVSDLNRRYYGKIKIVFKHFPLGKACNPLITQDLHPRACEAAFAAEAARKQGKFWSFHDALFATDLNNSHKTVSLIALKLGLNSLRFENDRTGDSAMARVEKNINLAIKLGVKATPTVFLNGRVVNDLRFASLQILINNELQHPVSH